MRIQKSHIHAWYSVENAKTSPTHQQNISDRRNAHYETDLENTEELYNTTADDAVPQHFNRYDALSQRSIHGPLRSVRIAKTVTHNTLCPDVTIIMRCTPIMCSEYRLLPMLTVCKELTIRQLLLTIRNSVTLMDVTNFFKIWNNTDLGQKRKKNGCIINTWQFCESCSICSLIIPPIHLTDL